MFSSSISASLVLQIVIVCYIQILRIDDVRKNSQSRIMNTCSCYKKNSISYITKDLLTKELDKVKFKVVIKECCKWFNDWLMYTGEEMWWLQHLLTSVVFEMDQNYWYGPISGSWTSFYQKDSLSPEKFRFIQSFTDGMHCKISIQFYLRLIVAHQNFNYFRHKR